MFNVAARAVVRGRCFARLVGLRPSGIGTHCISIGPGLRDAFCAPTTQPSPRQRLNAAYKHLCINHGLTVVGYGVLRGGGQL